MFPLPTAAEIVKVSFLSAATVTSSSFDGFDTHPVDSSYQRQRNVCVPVSQPAPAALSLLALGAVVKIVAPVPGPVIPA